MYTMYTPDNFQAFPWMEFAHRELIAGVKEVSGSGCNPNIMAYWQGISGGISNDEVHWCSAFVNWCMENANIYGTSRSNARSWLQWGVEIHEPIYGCVTILKREESSTKGHVGFFAGIEGNKIILLGGNQGNAVSLRGFYLEDLLGYRYPEGFLNSC
jgi:uncharacterized protein (TIGR02594 family)